MALVRTGARAAALFAVAVGVLVLAGWLLDSRALMQVLSGSVAMVPNTAVAFILAGLALWLQVGAESRSSLFVSRAAAAISGLLGLISLAEYFVGAGSGIDELLFRDTAGLTGFFPGRMAVPAAIGFAVLGGALLLSSLRRARWASESLALLPGLLGLVSLAGYAYGVSGIAWIGQYKAMAIHTAVTFLVLSFGFLLSQADGGFVRLITSDTVGGKVARRILPVALGVPLVLGWLHVTAERAGLYNPGLGTALTAVSNAVVLVVIFWAIAAALMRADEKRRSAEDALEGSERRLRGLAAIVESSDDAIIGKALDGTITSWNVGAERLYGWPASEAVGQPIGFHIPPGRQDEMRVIMEKVRRGEALEHFETVRLRKSGDPIAVSLTVSPIRGGGGEVLGASSIARDITGSKRLEEALRNAEEQYRLLFENSPIPMWVVDAGTLRYLAANDAAVAHYGYSREEFLAMTIDRIRPPEDVESVRRAVPKGKAGIEKKGVWRHLKKDGTLIQVEIVTHPMEFAGRRAWLAAAYDITERLRAEESLQRLLHAVEHAENVIFMTDRDGKITYVNPAFEKLYGYSKEETLGKTPRILKSGQHDRAYYEEFWRRLLAGESVQGEFVNRTRGGRLVTIEAFISPVPDPEGRVTGFIAVQHDVTERLRSEENLRKSERRFSLAFHESPIPTCISEIGSGRILDANERFLATLGYSSAEVLGRTSFELGIWADPASRDRAAARVRTEKEIDNQITRIRTRTGEIREVVGSAVPIDLGSLKCVLWTFVDVTERQRAEKEMRKSEERFRKLFDSNTIGITIADLEGNTYEVNDAYLQMLGYTREDLLAGKVRWTDRTPHEYQARDAEAAEELRRTGIASPWEKELLRKDGTRVPVLIGVAMLKASEEGRCIAYTVDLTERRNLEEQFRQAQKMEAVGQLAGGVAHDFNNMLTAILGYSELLSERFEAGSEEFEGLEEIRKAAERAASLTRQLLAFSRQQVLERRVLDLNHLIEEVEKMLRRLIGEDIELNVTLAPALWRVQADAGQLEQVLLNLAVNARDAMPQGGKLTIETGNVELDDAYARQHLTVRPGRYVMIAVSDTGIGMDSRTLSRVFEPFFTTKERGKGTGLGLATVYGIVKQSGGYIWVYSEPGQGTAFKIYLPPAEEGAEEDLALQADPSALYGSETVLLVEDEESVRSLSRTILEAFGYTVLEADGGEQALEIVRSRSQPVDLVLTDVVMPAMSGTELVSRLEEAHPGIRSLYMSGYTDDAVVRHGLLEKGRVFLQKPFTPGALGRKVREALGG